MLTKNKIVIAVIVLIAGALIAGLEPQLFGYDVLIVAISIFIITGAYKSFYFTDVEENTGTEVAIERLQTIFSSASKFIDIVAGDLTSDVYEDFRITSELKRAIDHGVIIRILHDRDIDNKTKTIPQLNSEHKITLLRLPKEVPAHFCIVDGLHTRIEKDHDKRTAIVRYQDPFLGSNAEKIFNSLLLKAK